MMARSEMRPSTSLLLGAAAIAATVAAVWILWPTPPTERADLDDARQVALGEAVYRQHCASCHGAELEGQPDWRVGKPGRPLPASPSRESAAGGKGGSVRSEIGGRGILKTKKK